MAFLDPQGDTIATVVEHHDGEVRVREAPAVRVPVAEAVAALARARRDETAHPAARFWGAASLVALQLVARGRILPGVTAGEHDSWRAGPFDEADARRIRELADAMPAAARALPVDADLRLAEAEGHVRAFLDAVADAMPRSPGAVRATGTSAFAAAKPVKVPRLRTWAAEVSAGLDSGVRLSLRLETGDPARAEFRAVAQLHSLADPSLVVDAADLWEGRDPGFGGAGQDRRDHRHPPRRPRLAAAWTGCWTAPCRTSSRCPTTTSSDLLAGAADRLAAAGVEVHWPRSLVQGLSARGGPRRA